MRKNLIIIEDPIARFTRSRMTGMAFRMTIFSLFFLLFFFQNNSVFAQSEKFSVTSDSTYKIAENGLATVTQNFIFTNLTTQYFPAQYLANLPQKEIYNLRAYDNTGALKIETKIVDNIRQINIKFAICCC